MTDYRTAMFSAVKEAQGRVTIVQAWRELGLPNCPDRPHGLFRSPFRPDSKPSFSVFHHEGRDCWKDQATGQGGGVFQFVTTAKPEWAGSSKEARTARQDFFFRLSGVQRPAWKAPTSTEKRAWQQERQEERRQERERARARHDQGRCVATHRRADLPAWPAAVRERFLEGAVFEGFMARCEALDAARGWGEGWSAELRRLDKLAFPLLPWDRQRQAAFRVEVPLARDAAPCGSLRTVGYHQKFVINAERGWLFCPHVPKRTGTEYQQALATHARTLNAKPGESLLPPLPFVLGNPCSLGRGEQVIVVVHEGQWDAACFYGALGLLDCEAGVELDGLPNVVVFGIRGTNGIREWMQWWGPWLRWVRPRLLVMPDDDRAGGRWTRSPIEGTGLRGWSPIEQLAHLANAEVKLAKLKAPGSKDFNDFYTALRPSRYELWEWLEQQA